MAGQILSGPFGLLEPHLIASDSGWASAIAMAWIGLIAISLLVGFASFVVHPNWQTAIVSFACGVLWPMLGLAAASIGV